MSEQPRLERQNGIIAGVCGGIASREPTREPNVSDTRWRRLSQAPVAGGDLG